MNRSSSSKHLRFAAASAALLLAIQSTSSAATKSWSPTAASNDASLGSNWTGGVAPVSGADILNFTTSTTLNPSFNGNITLKGANSISFASASANFTLGGNGTLTLDSGTAGSQVNLVVANNTTFQTSQVINNNLVLTNSANSSMGATITTSASTNALTFGGSVTNGLAQLNLTGSNAGSAMTFAALGGSTPLNITSTGTVTITNASGLTGNVTATTGTLVLGSGLGTGGNLILSGAANSTLKLNSGANLANTVNAAVSGAAKTSLQVDSGNATIAGVISGARSLDKTGAGTLILSGDNTLTGAIGIAAGTLQVGNAGTTGSLGTGAVANNGTLTFSRSDNALNVANTITGSGTINQSGNATTLSGDLTGFTGAINVTAGTLTVSNNSALTLAQSITSAAGASFAKTGSGNLTLSGANTINGSLVVGVTTASSGVVVVTSSAALGGSGGVTISPTGANTGSLRLDGSGGDITSALGLGINGRTTPSTQIENTAGNNALSGLVTLGGGTGTQNYKFDVSAGSLTLGGTLNGGGSGGVSRTLFLGGAGNTILSGAITNNANTTLALTKTDAGTLTLSGVNTYNGATTINGGTLLLNGDNSAATGAVSIASGAKLGGVGTVGGATTITGTVSPGAVAAAGALSFANGLQIDGTYAWEINANSLASGFDSLNVTGGNIALGAASAFNITALAGVDFSNAFWTGNRTWTVINNTGSGSITGTFFDLNGATSNAYGSFSLAYDPSAGGDVTLLWNSSAIPEPSAFAALAGLGSLALASGRRRRAVR